MHSNYWFLMSLELCKKKKKIKDSDVASQAASEFASYEEHHTDENNYSSVLDLVTSDGRYLALYSELEKKPKPMPTFALYRRGALDCAALDMSLYDNFSHFGIVPETEDDKKLRALKFKDVVKQLNQLIPARLSIIYNNMAGRLGKDVAFEGYKRHRLVTRYELFRSADTVPFSTNILTPYDYRAYDLTHGKKPNAILRVDIHT